MSLTLAFQISWAHVDIVDAGYRLAKLNIPSWCTVYIIILYLKKDFIIIFIASLSYFFGWVNNAYSLLQMEVQLFYTLRYTSTREVLYGWIHELCQLHTQERNRLWNLKLLGYQRGRPPKKALCVSRHTCGWVTFTITIYLLPTISNVYIGRYGKGRFFWDPESGHEF